MSDVSDEDVIRAMRHYGGSFAKSLAEAAMRADPENLARIKMAWPDYWQRYSQLAKMMPKE